MCMWRSGRGGERGVICKFGLSFVSYHACVFMSG